MGKLLTWLVGAAMVWGAIEVHALSTELGALKSEVSTLAADNQALADKLGACESVDDEVDALKSDLESLDSRVGDLEP